MSACNIPFSVFEYSDTVALLDTCSRCLVGTSGWSGTGYICWSITGGGGTPQRVEDQESGKLRVPATLTMELLVVLREPVARKRRSQKIASEMRVTRKLPTLLYETFPGRVFIL